MSRQLRALFSLGFLIAGIGCFDGVWQTRRTDPDEGPPAELVIRNETRERREFGRQVRALLESKQYDSLDHIARRLRQERTRWPNGSWKLRSYYVEGFDGPVLKTGESQWKTFLAQIREWTAARPSSVTAQVALGHALIEYAWHARGGGWAHEVTDAGHQLLHERLDQAGSVLQAAARLPEFCPATADALLRVALADHDRSRERYDSLFNAAVAGEPSYEAYYERKAYYLLPRWHGREGEWQHWADQVADRIGGQEGDAMYARIVWLLAEYHDTDMFKDGGVSWERTSRGYQYLTRTYPNSLELQSQYALLATWVEDRSHARAMFERIGPRVEPTVWSSRDGFVQWRDWAMQ
jgi:hypothetical protein